MDQKKYYELREALVQWLLSQCDGEVDGEDKWSIEIKPADGGNAATIVTITDCWDTGGSVRLTTSIGEIFIHVSDN